MIKTALNLDCILEKPFARSLGLGLIVKFFNFTPFIFIEINCKNLSVQLTISFLARERHNQYD